MNFAREADNNGISERKWAKERMKHLTGVLRAILNINQLITREKDRQRLLKGVCDTLIEARGYHYAWVAIFGEFGELVTTAESGYGKDFSPLVEYLKRGKLPPCGRKALGQPDAVMTEDPRSTCADCRWAVEHPGRRPMTVHLAHAGKVYGLLSVCAGASVNADEEERTLFQEVAGDIAFALHSIELEERRKQAEKALRESEEKYRKRAEKALAAAKAYAESIIENFLDTLIVVDAEARIQMVNPATCHLLGYIEEEIIGQPVGTIFAEDAAAIDRVFRFFREPENAKAVRPAYTIRNCELTYKTKDGRLIPMSFNASVLRDEAGRVTGVVAGARDMTERKRAEEELRGKEMQLIHAGRLSSLGEMATGVVHEIRQPLAIISMVAEGRLRDIQRGRFDVSILPQELEDILKNVRRIDRIITHMQTFARRAEEWESVEPEKMLDDAFLLLGEQFRIHGISISREIEAGLPAIRVDMNQLEQVFVNILTNARQVLDERAEEAERDGKAFKKRLVCGISRAKEAAGEYVVFEFADNAYGVPDEMKTRIFDPFFTTKEAGQGTGLGLSIAYGIVTRSLGGRIWVEDNEMGGASFKVALRVGELEDGRENEGTYR